MQQEAIITELAKNSKLSEFAAEFEKIDFANVKADIFIVFAVKNNGINKPDLGKKGDDGFDIMRHVVEGKYTKQSLTDGQILTALGGIDLTITINEGAVYINDVALGEEITVDNSSG